jgi:gliding motility-associated-like protein
LTYSFDGGTYSGTTSYSGLLAGSVHSVTSKNATGCVSNAASPAIASQPLTPAAPAYVITNPTCATSTGTIDITPVAGLTYSFDGSAYSAITSYSGLVVGSTHTIKAQNATNCVSNSVTTTAIPAQPAIPPTPTIIVSDVCVGAAINLTTPTVVGATYNWTGPNGFTSTSQNPILANAMTTMSGVYELSITLNSSCPSLLGSKTINVVPAPMPTLAQDGFVCIDSQTNTVLNTYTFNAGLPDAQYTFEWFTIVGTTLTAIPGQVLSNYPANAPGVYGVIATTKAAPNCPSQLVTAPVGFSSAPTSIELITSAYFANVQTITVMATPVGNYEYQIDGGGYQSSNVFNNVGSGIHTIDARDYNSCSVISKQATIVDYPKYFTPNADGVHDTWNISALSGQANAKIYIFDRFGKLIKEIRPSSAGWNGEFIGSPLPATDYWFSVDYQENAQEKTYKGHFALKR